MILGRSRSVLGRNLSRLLKMIFERVSTDLKSTFKSLLMDFDVFAAHLLRIIIPVIFPVYYPLYKGHPLLGPTDAYTDAIAFSQTPPPFTSFLECGRDWSISISVESQTSLPSTAMPNPWPGALASNALGIRKKVQYVTSNLTTNRL